LRDAVVILLTSAGQSEAPVPGVDAELIKPVRPSQLFDTLHAVLAARSARHVGPLAVDHSAIAPAARQPARVLIVEDNAANLKVAVRMVQRLGYGADVA